MTPPSPVKEHTMTSVAPVPSARQTVLTQASRSLLVDAVRGFAIILVVLGHTDQGLLHRGWWGTSTLGVELESFIYAFHMAAFFFVSGIFLKASIAKRGVPRFLRERFFSLLWPYFLWSCVTTLALVPLASLTAQGSLPFRLFPLFLITGRISWFLPTIFFALLLVALTVRVPMALTLPASIALAALPLHTQFVFVSNGLRYLPFLLLGMFVGPRVVRLEKVPVALAVLVVLLLGVAVGYVTHHGLQHSTAGYLLTGVAGTAMLFLVARCLQGTNAARGLAWVGAASLAIFLLSEFPQGGGRVLVTTLFHTEQPLLQLAVPTALAVAVPAWLYHRRYALKIAWMFEAPFAAGRERKAASLS